MKNIYSVNLTEWDTIHLNELFERKINKFVLSDQFLLKLNLLSLRNFYSNEIHSRSSWKNFFFLFFFNFFYLLITLQSKIIFRLVKLNEKYYKIFSLLQFKIFKYILFQNVDGNFKIKKNHQTGKNNTVYKYLCLNQNIIE